jgi:hypothetical protein
MQRNGREGKGTAVSFFSIASCKGWHVGPTSQSPHPTFSFKKKLMVDLSVPDQTQNQIMGERKNVDSRYNDIRRALLISHKLS